MYLVGVDRSWFHTPFLRHKFLITHQSELDILQRSGICEVTIDTEQGIGPDASPGSASTGNRDVTPSPVIEDRAVSTESRSAEAPTVSRLAENLAVAK
jgi:hypothetical protein